MNAEERDRSIGRGGNVFVDEVGEGDIVDQRREGEREILAADRQRLVAVDGGSSAERASGSYVGGV